MFEQAQPLQPGPQPVCSPWAWSLAVAHGLQAARVRTAFRGYLLRYATLESDVPGAELIFGELCGNVVRHAPGPASFALDWHDLHPTLLVTDQGAGFGAASAGTLADPSAESGRGLALVRTLAVHMLFGNRPEGGAYVRVVLPVRRLHTAE